MSVQWAADMLLHAADTVAAQDMWAVDTSAVAADHSLPLVQVGSPPHWVVMGRPLRQDHCPFLSGLVQWDKAWRWT